MTTIITFETPREEIERASSIIASELKDKFKNGDYPHACSDLIHLEAISTLSEIAWRLMALTNYHFRQMALMMRDIGNTSRPKQKSKQGKNINNLTGYASPDILCLQLPTGVAL